MFERVTGFFRRFGGGKKKKTAETAFLDDDDAGLDDFGLDDADFGDSVGTQELEGSPGGFDTGDDFDAMETFESTGAEQTSLSGGSGENLLDDSLAGAETFETLGEFEGGSGSGVDDVNFDTPQPANRDLSSGGSEDDDFGDDFGDLGGDFDSAGSSEVGADDFDLPETPAASAPGISIPKTLAVLVVGLILGVVISGVIMPLLSGKGEELDNKLRQVDSNVQKASRELKQYENFGGIATLELEKAELDGLAGAQGATDDARTAAEAAREQRAEYEAIVAAKTDAETQRVETETLRQGLQVKIDAAEMHLARQQQAIGAAMGEYQQKQRAMEDSSVVADAFERADRQYTYERTREIIRAQSGAGD